MKSQAVRLVDVLALGPFLMWSASAKQLPDWARATLWLSGLLTVTYNARNYLRHGGT